MDGHTFDAVDVDVTRRAESRLVVRHVYVSIPVLDRLRIPTVLVSDVLH